MKRLAAVLLVLGLLPACSALEDAAPQADTAPTSTLVAMTATPSPIPPTAVPTDANLLAPGDVGDRAAPTASAQPASASLPDDAIAQELVRLARQQVAQETNLPLQRVRVVSVEAATWTDSALNCPLPEAIILPLQIDGYRIALMAGGRDYIFHTDIDRVIRCDPANEATPEATPPAS